MTDYLIYGLKDPETKQLRYIGKSTNGLRRPKAHLNPSRLIVPSHKNNWLKQLLAKGFKPEIIIIQEFEDYEYLYIAEQSWIRYFRKMGCPLTNLTDGGAGATGFHWRHSEESKKRMSLSKIGSKNQYARGAVFSEKTKIKISAALKGNKNRLNIQHNEETKIKISRAHGISSFRDNLGNIYQTINGAARALNLDFSHIGKVLRGDRKSTGGYRFFYI